MADQKQKRKFRLLGQSGLRVSPLTLGTMHFGEAWIDRLKLGTPFDEAEAVFLEYIGSGGNFIDTAVNYQDGQSEEFIGRIMVKNEINRDDLVIATKFSLPIGNSPNNAGNTRKNLVVSLNKSLKRLQTDYVDVLYVHFFDGTIDMVEIMRNLNAVVQQGKVLYLGVSDTPAWQVSRANAIAEANGWAPFTVYQGKYNLLDRGMENDILPMCRALNIASTNWSALASGRLLKVDGKQRRNNPISDEEKVVVDLVEEIATSHNTTSQAVCLAWSKAKVTTVLLGPRTLKHLKGNLEAMHLDLSDEDVKRLDEATSKFPAKIFPQSMIGTGIAHPWIQFMVSDPYDLDA